MINVNIADISSDLLQHMENTITTNQPIKVDTNKGGVVIISESNYKKLCDNSLEQLSPEELEELEDEVLLEMAVERFENHDPSTRISFDDLIAKYGYTRDDFGEWTELDEADLE